MAAKRLIDRLVERGVRAAAEGLFPSATDAPDHESAELVPRTLSYLDELPAPQARLLKLLFCFLELCGGLLALRFARFSGLRPIERAAAVRSWRRSRFFVLRVLGDAVKAAMTMIYMSDAGVLEHIGVYKTCARPADALKVAHRPQALREAAE